MDNDNLVKLIKHGADTDGEKMLALYNNTLNLFYCLIKGSKPQDREDLTQNYFLWLCDAVSMFNENQGTKFTSFLMARLRGNIQSFYAENRTIVHVPRNRLADLNKYEKERRRLSDIMGREPTDKELCSFMRLKPGELRQIKKDLQAIATAQSLNEENQDGATLGDTLTDPADFAEDLAERLSREKAFAPLWRAVCNESGLDRQTITNCICVENRGKYDVERPKLNKAIRKIKQAPAKYGALQKALEYQGVNFCRHKGTQAFMRDNSSVVEDIAIKELERREIMIEYATRKQKPTKKTEEGTCSICGKAGAERRMLPNSKAIEYTIKGKRDTRGAVLVCDECLSKQTRETHIVCEVLEDGSVVEFR